MRLLTTSRFERDLERAGRRGKDLDKLWAVVDRLLGRATARTRVTGPIAYQANGPRSWECHIEPDWLLIWHVGENDLVLARTGSHSDLFG